MPFQIPTGFSYVGAPTGPATATNQYGFGANSLNFAPATDFYTAPKTTTTTAPAVTATPIATPVAAPVVPTPIVAAPAPVMIPTPLPAQPVAQPIAQPVAQPVAAPPAYSLPAGFTIKAPTPAPVAQPIATPAPTPTPGPVAPQAPKAPVVIAPPPPPPVDPRTAALRNSGYTDAQIAAAGGPAALLAKVNTPAAVPNQPAKTPTSAVNYTWADLNSAVAALQKANPKFAVQGQPITRWSTNGVASLAKTDPTIFKALQTYLPKY